MTVIALNSRRSPEEFDAIERRNLRAAKERAFDLVEAECERVRARSEEALSRAYADSGIMSVREYAETIRRGAA